MQKSRDINQVSNLYIIAEIGHSHAGSISKALEIIRRCADGGARAVKFQKRDSNTLYTKNFYNSPYHGPYSFGSTYGQHRDNLEPHLEMLEKANQLAHDLKLDFIVTPFDHQSLSFCEKHLGVDHYKIASGDITNHVLIESICSTNKHILSSCGAATFNEIKEAHSILKFRASSYTLLYTFSEYPLQKRNILLGSINYLKDMLKLDVVGYSCHSADITVTQMAIALGCKIVEKHIKYESKITLRDDEHAIIPEDIELLYHQTPIFEKYLDRNWHQPNSIHPDESNARVKLGKSLYFGRNIEKGELVTAKDILCLTPAIGLPPYILPQIIGKRIVNGVEKEQLVKLDDLE